MEETVFVYVNLNSYPVVVNGPFGGPITIPRNRAVKGEYFARFAQPQGSLSMVNEKIIAPTAIIFDAKPVNDVIAEAWANDKIKADPALTTQVPPSLMPKVTDVVVEVDDDGTEGTEEFVVTEVDGETLHVDKVSTEEKEDIVVPSKKTKKKTKK